MFLFPGVTYFLAPQYGHGALCSQTGDIDVEDKTACKEAAEKLGYTYRSTENRSDFPKGCYLLSSSGPDNGVWFNRHTRGRQQRRHARQICKRFVITGLSSFVTSLVLLLYIFSIENIFPVCRVRLVKCAFKCNFLYKLMLDKLDFPNIFVLSLKLSMRLVVELPNNS